jgi:hypothetical protein
MKLSNVLVPFLLFVFLISATISFFTQTTVGFHYFKAVVTWLVPRETVLVDLHTGECWRIMDWTSKRLVHCDVPHPSAADTEVVDDTSREEWLRRYGG